MNSITIGQVQSSPVSTTTDNQCAFSDTFTTLRAKGLSQHPTRTTTLVISIDNEGVIDVGGSAGAVSTLLSGAGQLITLNGTTEVTLDPGTNGQVLTANSSAADGIEWADLPAATPTTLGSVYGNVTSASGAGSISIGYSSSTGGSYNTAMGINTLNAVITGTLNAIYGNGVGQKITSGSNNSIFGVNACNALTTGSNNTVIGETAGSGSSGGFLTASNNIAIGYWVASGATDTAADGNIYIGNYATTGATGVTGSIIMGYNAQCSSSNEFLMGNIDHLNIPSLTTDSVGTGALVQFGGSQTGWVQAAGGTNNTVAKIDTAISTLQSSVTTNTSDITTLLSGGTVFTALGSYTVPSNVTSITIEAMGGGGGGSGGGTGSDGAWDGGGGGGSGSLEKITIPETSGQVIDRKDYHSCNKRTSYRFYYWNWRVWRRRSRKWRQWYSYNHNHVLPDLINS